MKYLTSIGCGCYDADGSVTDALVAAAESCTESVRLATVEAIHEAANGRCCSECGQTCCCNEKISKKLHELAYDRDDTGCFKEPSERVRQAAADALAACCPNPVPPTIVSPEAPPAEQPRVAPEASPSGEESVAPEGTGVKYSIQDGQFAGLGTQQNGSQDSPMKLVSLGGNQASGAMLDRMHKLLEFSPHVGNMISNPNGGIVLAFDGAHSVAYVQFENAEHPLQTGMRMQLTSDPRFGYQPKGIWEVIEVGPAQVCLRPIATDGCLPVRISDHAFFVNMEQVASTPVENTVR